MGGFDNITSITSESCKSETDLAEWLNENQQNIEDRKSIFISLSVADKDRYAEYRNRIIEWSLQIGLFLKALIVTGGENGKGEPQLRLTFSNTREDWIQYTNTLSNKFMVPENHRSCLIRVFIIHGLRHYLSLKKRDDVIINNKGRRFVPLGDIAQCYNGKSVPIAEDDGSSKKYACITPAVIDMNLMVEPKTKLDEKPLDNHGGQTIKLSNCIVVKNFFYKFNRDGFYNPDDTAGGAAIVTGSIDCYVEKTLHVIELSPYIDKRYLSFLLCYMLFCNNFRDQLIHFKDTYLKMTIDDLRRVIVPEPGDLEKMTMPEDLSADKGAINFLRNLARDRGRPITISDIENAFMNSFK
jgi:hypothetical protein